jgi:gluconate 2-dehydrogenase gamma chain
MESHELSRRSLLQALAAAIGTATLPLAWVESARAAHAAGQSAGEPKLVFLNAAEAADVDALTAQIVPTDDTPGAREAGVVYFIDRALATFLAQLAGEYRAHLAEFQTTFRGRHPAAASFAALPSDQQIAYLRTVDTTTFFETTRLLTLLGMFSTPAYGGNRNGTGWKLIGFEDRHAFAPPFGYYDRDYPGFLADGGTKP